ncbi:hypothetical protein MIR68_012502 [Amoeboaphelidium protococcarum]|nr:hypothetical protein MIR68_012502 [Amoeboaphelidium protococcarum]
MDEQQQYEYSEHFEKNFKPLQRDYSGSYDGKSYYSHNFYSPRSISNNDLRRNQHEQIQNQGQRQVNASSQNIYKEVLTSVNSLVVPFRKFICKGSVWEVINNQLVKERSLFLFNDILIVAKKLSAGSEDSRVTSSQVDDTNLYEIRAILDLFSFDIRLDRNSDPADRFKNSATMRKALEKFDRHPQDGLSYLIEKQLIYPDAVAVAEFLFGTPQLNKCGIGRFLSSDDNAEIFEQYMNCFDFNGLRLDQALRLYFASFRPPGDAHAMDILLEGFSRKYHGDNSGVLSSPQLTLNLVFGLLVINSEMHNSGDGSHVSGRYKISVADFIAKFRLHDVEQELSNEVLVQMYQSIARDKLSVAVPMEHDTEELEEITVSQIPFRLYIMDKTTMCTVTIPRRDPNLVIHVFCHKGLRSFPTVLDFNESNTATFRLSGLSAGRKYITLLKLGSSAHKYSASRLPQNKMVIVEPPFKKHVFQMKCNERDQRTGRKVSYMFSVANEDQRDMWAAQIKNALCALQEERIIEDGVELQSIEGHNILSCFAVQQAKIVPSSNQVPLNNDKR